MERRVLQSATAHSRTITLGDTAMAQGGGAHTEVNSAEIVCFLFRSSAAFVLGVIFLLLPLAIADTGKPWYFWLS